MLRDAVELARSTGDEKLHGRIVILESLEGFQQAIDRCGVPRAGRHSVHRFGRQGHQLPFGQCLHGTMYHIAHIVRGSHIDHDGGRGHSTEIWGWEGSVIL